MPSDYNETETPTEVSEGAAVSPTDTGLSDTGIQAMQGPPETDLLQEDQAIETLRQDEAIQPEAWQGLNETERLGALQEVEGQMSASQGRPSAEVCSYRGGPGECGYYDASANQINVSDQHVMNDDVRDVVDTTVHEGRHAYQRHAVENPGFHDNPAEVEAWRENLQPGNYLTAEEYGQELYQGQPVEADAWSYSGRITDGVYGEEE